MATALRTIAAESAATKRRTDLDRGGMAGLFFGVLIGDLIGVTA